MSRPLRLVQEQLLADCFSARGREGELGSQLMRPTEQASLWPRGLQKSAVLHPTLAHSYSAQADAIGWGCSISVVQPCQQN